MSFVRNVTQSTTIWRTSSPTGKNHVVKRLREFRLHLAGILDELCPRLMSMCFSLSDAVAPSRDAREQREGDQGSVAELLDRVAVGITRTTCRICSMEGTL